MQTPSVIGAGKTAHTFDAIVIGSGISGGWAAKELCERGLKTLVLERGRKVEHIADYSTALQEKWEHPLRGRFSRAFIEANPILMRIPWINAFLEPFFVKDAEQPYEEVKPFSWVRGYQVGGKSLTWGRWTQRWSDLDFEANAKDGIAVDWPLRYSDLAPWYSHVEKFAGISGNRDGLAVVPDGEFLPPMEFNCIERHFKSAIAQRWPERPMIISRTANLTVPHLGRGLCQYRNRCNRGCPFSGYFSSNSATLPAAVATGNLTLRPDSVVHSIIYDDARGRATGVRVVDAHTKEMTEYFARIVFVNGGTLNSTLLLLNSTSTRFPNGLGNDSGQLGHNLMDHIYRVRARGIHTGFKNKYHFGRRPTGTLIPRFRNLEPKEKHDFIRGYALVPNGSRSEQGGGAVQQPGAESKERYAQLGPWTLSIHCMAEHLPVFKNHVSLHPNKRDAWGIPELRISCTHGENERAMIKDIMATAGEMLEHAGFEKISVVDTKEPPGTGIHEMGTCRMGRDPKTSLLNGFNQMHAVPNVFVTDGACMTSGAWQNPSLTYMALTARAANHAADELTRLSL
jgi:choline dehydrogenase-like flavoprotein